MKKRRADLNWDACQGTQENKSELITHSTISDQQRRQSGPGGEMALCALSGMLRTH